MCSKRSRGSLKNICDVTQHKSSFPGISSLFLVAFLLLSFLPSLPPFHDHLILPLKKHFSTLPARGNTSDLAEEPKKEMISQAQGQKYLCWSRWTVLTLALITGMLFSAYYNREYYGANLLTSTDYLDEVAREALPFIVTAVYGYALWGHKRFVPIYLRAFLVVGLAVGWLYLVLVVFARMQSGPKLVLGCFVGYKTCIVGAVSDLFGAVAGFMMLAEVVLTLKFGPYNPNSATQQGESGKVTEPTQHSAPIFIPGQYQYQQQQPQFQQQNQYQPQFQQHPPPQLQQAQSQQQQFIPMTDIQPQQSFAYTQPHLSPPPALNYSTRPQQEGAGLPTSP